MATTLVKRAARLAVSRFGVDARRVRQACREALRARAGGADVDLVAELLRNGLITPEQAAEIRDSLDKTHIDPNKSAAANGNGAAADLNDARTRTAPPLPSLQAPQQVGEYRLLRKLGAGGMGSVYLAYKESEDQQLAVKLLAPQFAANPVFIKRFEREAYNSTRLNHPNIVRGFGVGRDEKTGFRYLVMEFVDGPSVQALLDKHGRLKVADAVLIALDIAYALEHAHARGIIHRDIKPENILITLTGIAKLGDLGLAKQVGEVSHLTATKQGFGTPYYMPYEQAINAKRADNRSDIYSLGATLYHMLTGKPPFQGGALIEVLEKKEAGQYEPANHCQPDVPEELSQIIDRMMATDPRDRYQMATEVVVDLERTQLAGDVVSFVDQQVALHDPQVRARLESTNLETRPDLGPGALLDAESGPKAWYLKFLDRTGEQRRVKATTEQVFQRINKGQLNGTTLASPSPRGRFRPLGAYPVFFDALREQRELKKAPPAPQAEAPTPWYVRRRWWLVAGGVLAAVLLFSLAAYLAS